MSPFEKLMALIGDRKIPVPALPSLPRYRIAFANRHVMKIILLTALMAAAVVVVGMVFAIRDVAYSSWDWPESGAAYYVNEDGLGTMGQELPKHEDGTSDQTLEVRMAANSRINALSIDLQMGVAGQNCISIARVTNTTGFLWADTVTIDGLVAPTLTLDDSVIHKLILSGKVDGHHTGPTQSFTAAPDVAIESTRGAGEYTAEGGSTDKLVFTLAGDAYVKNLTLTGKCSTGAVDLQFLKVGTLTISNVRVGDDGNINTPALSVNATTIVHTVQDTLVDQTIVVK